MKMSHGGREQIVPPAIASTILVSHPTIVIGIPCYNEEKYLERAIRSLMDQSWTDFAVLISDNASTDGSGAIAQQAVERDARFHFVRQPENIGAAANFNFIKDATQSPLFMWLGSHDYVKPTFLEKLVPPLLNDKTISLAHCEAGWIDRSGTVISASSDERMSQLPDVPAVRYVASTRLVEWCTEINNVIRRDALAVPFSSLWGCDKLILADLAYRGKYHYVPEQLYMFMVVVDDERSQDYMERLTGKVGVKEEKWPLALAFIDHFSTIERNYVWRKLGTFILRAQLEKSLMPDDLGMGAKILTLAGRMKALAKRR